MTSLFTQTVTDALVPLADTTRAAGMQAYMRGKFSFLGVAAPQRRAAVMPMLRERLPATELLAAAVALWEMPQREYQYVAADLLARQEKTLTSEHLDTLFELAQRHAWWDTVDGLATTIGSIIKHACKIDPSVQEIMDDTLAHEDFWMRRIAMLHQLSWRGDTDTRRLFHYALTLANDKEFFIRKAIGWALRDYARHDPEAVRTFLDRSAHKLSALTVREASKHL